MICRLRTHPIGSQCGLHRSRKRRLQVGEREPYIQLGRQTPLQNGSVRPVPTGRLADCESGPSQTFVGLR